MHKIIDDTATAEPVLGEWTEGGAGGSPPATIIKSAWMNSVQRELLNLLSDAAITPSGAADNQVLASLQRLFKIANDFRPKQNGVGTMTIKVGGGNLWTSPATVPLAGFVLPVGLMEIAEQTTATITAPVTNPRIDRVVIDPVSGAIQIVVGTENASPVAPNFVLLGTGRAPIPIARIALSVGQTQILQTNITDERPVFFGAPPLAGVLNGLATLDANGYLPVTQNSRFRGALVTQSVYQELPSAQNTLLFNSESYDTSGIHDNTTNTDRLTVPVGVSKVKLSAFLGVSLDDSTYRQLLIRKNGSATGQYVSATRIGTFSRYAEIKTPVISVIPGDYFSLIETHGDAATPLVLLDYNYFSMEVVE